MLQKTFGAASVDNFKTASSHKIPNHGHHPPSVQPLSGPVTHKGAKLAMNNNDPEFSNTHQFTHPKWVFKIAVIIKISLEFLTKKLVATDITLKYFLNLHKSNWYRGS